jgi:hypothetical protein
MICYRDRTFCQYYETCKNGKECDRSLTTKVIDDAEQWWGSKDAPICVFGEKPDCFEEKNE